MSSINRRKFLINGLIAGGGLLLPPATLAINRNPKRIPSAYIKYAKEAGVPPAILYTLAHVESRNANTGHPTTYAMNFRGVGYYFSSQSELLTNAKFLLENGYQSFDIGPVQVNWRWHSSKFNSIEDAVNPHVNTQVGAAYLKEKFDEYGNWFIAGGKYHSPGSKPKQRSNAAKYAKRMERTFRELGYETT